MMIISIIKNKLEKRKREKKSLSNFAFSLMEKQEKKVMIILWRKMREKWMVACWCWWLTEENQSKNISIIVVFGVVVTLEFFFYNKICPIYKSDDDGTKKSLKSEFEKNWLNQNNNNNNRKKKRLHRGCMGWLSILYLTRDRKNGKQNLTRYEEETKKKEETGTWNFSWSRWSI